MTAGANAGILDGIRIVDLSDGIAGPVATLLLAEAGADVVTVEPPGGAASRARPGFRTWNRSKRSVVLDVDREDGRAELDALLAAADVVVHNFGPARARELALDDDRLARAHPQLIACSVLSWPANHADADRPVDELLAAARLGVFDEQYGYRDGPIFLRVPIGNWAAVYNAAAGIVARLVVRQRTGRAGPAHTSLVQGTLGPMAMHWRRAERPSPSLEWGMPKSNTMATLFECGDGVWIHHMGRTELSPLMDEVIEELGSPAMLPAEQTGTLRPGYAREVYVEAFKRRPSKDWLEDFWAHDVPVQPAVPLGEVLHDEQSRANEYVIEIDDPVAGHITVPGLPLTISPPQRVRGTAPDLGAHTDEVRAEWQASNRAKGTGADSNGERGTQRWPLEGVKVLDLGNFLAGPFGPMLLADMGAEVVKLESATGDPMRHVEWSFIGCQRGKRSVALDLKSPDARPALEALIRWADVVHHNLRMPAAKRLGLDYESVRAVKPDVVFCHTSSYGPRGPRADWPGYDQLFQSSCGWEVAGAGEGNPPMWHRLGFCDHLCAMASVVSTLLALYHRDATGEGQAVAASLLGAGVLTNSETYLDDDGQLAPVPALDHEQTGIAPGYRIVPVADGWVAIAATAPEHLEALCSVAGVDDVAAVADGMRDRKADEILAALEAAGVPSEPVRQDQNDPFFASPENQAAGLVARYPHPIYGTVEQPGAFWWFGDLDVRLDKAPPALGEHTVEILEEVGLARDEIDRLVAAGVATVFAP
ncbi:MAG TPA: CoA transferase [Acidimicrobiia bacterium]|nr:CoA transferase [Acidimicrobiia bacterium]